MPKLAVASDAFASGDGPRSRLVPAANAAIQEVAVRARSLERARKLLAEQHLLGEGSAGAVSIAPQAIGGLSFPLVGSPAPLDATTASTHPQPTDGP